MAVLRGWILVKWVLGSERGDSYRSEDAIAGVYRKRGGYCVSENVEF